MPQGAVVPAPPESVEGGALESGPQADAIAEKAKKAKKAKKAPKGTYRADQGEGKGR